MTKEEIMNIYAIYQGYESWEHLIISTIQHYGYVDATNHITTLFNAVTNLIQEELKRKIAKIEDIYAEDFNEFGDAYTVIGTIKESILNTEIL